MLKKGRLSLLIIIFLCIIVRTAIAVPSATDQVQETVDGVIDLLKDHDLDRGKRREMISSLIRKRFNFAIMSQQVLATNWKKATSEERNRFMNLFSDLLEETYMERIEAYTNEKVEYVNEKTRENRAIVETIIVTKSADIPIHYKMVQKDSDWFVYDVVIEEVSLVRNYRSSYREIVMKEGIEGLLKRMEDKVKEMKESGDRANNQ